MIHLSGRKISRQAEIAEAKKLDSGTESRVSRITLKYKERARPIGGLVLKEILGADQDPNWADQQMRQVLETWNLIVKINERRNREKKTMFRLPGTIRGFQDKKRIGILMTDLSDNGEKEIFDLKDLIYFSRDDLTMKDWQSIKQQVLRDIEIAQEEAIDLDNGPEHVDPWLVVYDKVQKTYQVYLCDIGGYTHVYAPSSANKVLLKKGKRNILHALKAIEQGMEE